MKNLIDHLSVDNVGIVKLDDAELTRLETDFAAAPNAGRANGGCTNLSCGGTTNSACQNTVNCGGNYNSDGCFNGGANCQDLRKVQK